jgi:hypothetical protein
MKRFICLAAVAAVCAAALSASGCASAAAPHLRATAASPFGVHARARDGSVPNHVITMVVEDRAGQFDPVVAEPYLDYASVGLKDANAFHAAGIKTMYYTDPNRSHTGTPMYTKDETTFAHDCNNNRILVHGKPVTTYQMDPRSPHLEPLWAAWVASVLNAGYQYDYIFEDATNSIHNESARPCGYTEPSWTAASNANDIALGQHIIYNGLGTLTDGYNKPPPSFLVNPTTDGGMLEDCYVKDSHVWPKAEKVIWANYATTELRMIRAKRMMFCRDLIAFPAASSIDQRQYMYASFLMTYDPSWTILSEKFSTPSNLEIFPEEGLVALEPLIPTPFRITKLETSPWTYGRQYAACYLWGQPIGACATAVNSDVVGTSHPFPWPGVYNHTLVLNGGGILDGGTATVDGPAPPAVIPGDSSVIAIQ